MRQVLNAGCHLWQPEVTSYANAAYLAVYQAAKEIDPSLPSKLMPGYCSRLRGVRGEDGRLHYIQLNATNEHKEPERLRRLKRVTEALRGLPDSPVWKMQGLRDDDGNLTVTWSRLPSANDLLGARFVWHSSVGDGGGEVRHLFEGGDITRYHEFQESNESKSISAARLVSSDAGKLAA